MDSYQAIYDAVRSRISNGDLGSAVEQALHHANIGHYASIAAQSAVEYVSRATDEHSRPSVLFRPRLYIDGNSWCALYGDDLQCGVAGFGPSPDAACRDFDKQWNRALASPVSDQRRDRP